MMELSRSSEEAPLPRFAPAFGDLLTGGQLVAGVALALLHRQNTGEGTLVDANLLRAGLWVSKCRQTQAHQSAPSSYGPWC